MVLLALFCSIFFTKNCFTSHSHLCILRIIYGIWITGCFCGYIYPYLVVMIAKILMLCCTKLFFFFLFLLIAFDSFLLEFFFCYCILCSGVNPDRICFMYTHRKHFSELCLLFFHYCSWLAFFLYVRLCAFQVVGHWWCFSEEGFKNRICTRGQKFSLNQYASVASEHVGEWIFLLEQI